MLLDHTNRRRLAKGLSVLAVLSATGWGGAGIAVAQSIDPVTTASVTPRPPLQSRPQVTGFSRALNLVDTDPAAAYQLAATLTDPIERRVVQWAAVYYGGGAIDYQSVARLATDAPAYSSASFYKTRMEQALTRANPSASDVIAMLGGQMPNTIDGQIALARAYVVDGQRERAGRIIREVWINEFLNRDQEAAVVRDFSSLLSREDHWRRAVHLLMHDRASGTERIMDQLSPAQQSLALARIAVARKAGNAQALIDKVDPAYRNDPLFHFTRAQDARRKGQLATAVKFLDLVKGDAPDSAEFWYERRLIVRQALAAGDPKTAYAAAAGYTVGPEGRVVDANFHAGWIALKFLNNPQAAIPHFQRMKALSTLADTITQSNYWLGLAQKSAGMAAEAKASFTVAAAYHTVYYGQLAGLELGIKRVDIRDLPAWQASVPAFDQLELVKAVRLLAAHGQKRKAEPLVSRLAHAISDPGQLLLTARLAQSIDAHNMAILTADVADRRGVALDLFNFPKDGVPDNAPLAAIDKAAVYAVARQESKFDAGAISRVGARGLMQLMPSTAKEVAQKTGETYSPSRLNDPAFNAYLGSTYLASQLDRYDGSLVLAAAAYNAGAGNVNKWLKSFGDPRDKNVDPVSWIEAIPFVETRKYTQRVLGNYMVYRARMGKDDLTIADALRRIPH